MAAFPAIVEIPSTVLPTGSGRFRVCFRTPDGRLMAVPCDFDASDAPNSGEATVTWSWGDIPSGCRNRVYVIRDSAPPSAGKTRGTLEWAWSRSLARYQNDAVRALVLTQSPSYSTVLHDVSLFVGGRWREIYGWWAVSDAMLGNKWKTLGSPDFETVEPEKPRGQRFGTVRDEFTAETRLAGTPEARIETTYEFFRGFPGVRMRRTFSVPAKSGLSWGDCGYWLGGSAWGFPVFNAVAPTSYYYRGEWREKPVHKVKGDFPAMAADTGSDLRFAILYWDSTRVWLAMALEPASLESPFKTPQFVFRGGGMTAPSWFERTGPFTRGEFVSWYMGGCSSRSEAVATVESFSQSIGTKPRITSVAPESLGPIRDVAQEETGAATIALADHPPAKRDADAARVRLENRFVRLAFDPAECRVTELILRPEGRQTSATDLLAASGSGIWFTAGSRWQRSLDWRDTDNRHLVPDTSHATVETTSSNALRISGFVLADPETSAPVFRGDMLVALAQDRPSADFTCEYEAIADNDLPYLGWHFDFPKGSYRWFIGDGQMDDSQRWQKYRMGYSDLQPMRYGLGSQRLLAFPDKGGEGDLGLSLAYLPQTNVAQRACNLPNPLFDDPQGIQKIAMTATKLVWRFHNMRGIGHKAGERKTIAVRIETAPRKLLNDQPRRSLRLDLPASPETAARLDHFWIHHAREGPGGIEGAGAWWYTLVSRFNPNLSPTSWRDGLLKYLGKQSRGNAKSSERFIVPRGGLPLRENATDFNWNGGYWFEVNAHVVLSAEQYYLVTGDRDFLTSALPDLESAIEFYRGMVAEDGIVTLPEPFNGIDGPIICYWDAWNMGHKPAFIQMYAAGAVLAMARIEAAAGRPEKAAEYGQTAQRLQQALIIRFWREADLTDNDGKPIRGGRLISWVDRDGRKLDAGFTDLNLMAVHLGLLPPTHTKRVFEWLDDDPYAYAWRDKLTSRPVSILSFNTIDGNSTRVYWKSNGPRRYFAGAFNPFLTPSGMENGQIQYWVAGFDLLNRIRNGDAARAAKMLDDFLSRYARGDLNCGHGVPESRPLPMFQGTSQMSPLDEPCGSDQSLGEDGLIYGLGVVSGLLGLDCDYDGLRIRPNLPEAFRDATLSNFRYRSANLTVKYHGFGNRVRSVTVDGNPVNPAGPVIPFSWNPGAESKSLVDVVLEP